MVARAVDEESRVATPLELLFDLCFVVAVAQAAAELHHELAEGHALAGTLGFAGGFFAIWWAWMNFTWFASGYDTDDVLYRVAALVQMAGVLVLAAGVSRAVADEDYGVVTLGYAIMRLALVASWLRAARDEPDPDRAAGDLRWAIGIALCQVGWIGRLALPDGPEAALFVPLVLAELSVPVWAARRVALPWHPHHIAERYGLFTIIVLGESILAATVAFQTALDGGDIGEVGTVAVGGLLTVFAMWWLYFAYPAAPLLEGARAQSDATPRAFAWGYGHYAIFGAAAAVGAGVQVVVDEATGHAEVSSQAAAAAFAVPVALFLLAVWVIHARPHPHAAKEVAGYPVVAALVVASVALGEASVLAIGVLLTALVVGSATARKGAL